MNGKGDAPRPYSVPLEQYRAEHDRIFGGFIDLPKCPTCGVDLYAVCSGCDGNDRWRAK